LSNAVFNFLIELNNERFFSDYFKEQLVDHYDRLKSLFRRYLMSLQQTILEPLSHDYHQINQVRWDITKKCNLRCKHCYVGSTLTPITVPDPLSTKEVLALIKKFASEGVQHIQYLGGEPFSRADFTEILEETASCGMSFAVNTNGTYINAEIADRLSQLPKWAMTFSIDGPSSTINDMIRGNGVFERCKAGINALVNAMRNPHPHQTVAVNTVLTRESIGLIYEYFELAKEISIDVLQFNSLDYQGLASTSGESLGVEPSELLDTAVEIKRFANDAKIEVRQVYLSNIVNKYIASQLDEAVELTYGGCKAGKLGMFVDNTGRIYSCSELTYGRYPEQYNGYGTHYDASQKISDIFWSEAFVSMRQLRDEKVHRTKYTPCMNCEYKELCHPCPLPSISSDGDVNLLLCEEAHRRLGTSRYKTSSQDKYQKAPSPNASITEGLCK